MLANKSLGTSVEHRSSPAEGRWKNCPHNISAADFSQNKFLGRPNRHTRETPARCRADWGFGKFADFSPIQPSLSWKRAKLRESGWHPPLAACRSLSSTDQSQRDADA